MSAIHISIKPVDLSLG